MNFIKILLIIILIVLILFSIIVFTIYFKSKSLIRKMGYNGSSLLDMIKSSDEEAKYRHKSISGMSNILIPKILRDFPNFNESELYNKVETSLLAIFSSLSKKEVSDINELAEIRTRLIEEINNLKDSNTSISITDVVFHDHRLKSYQNSHGVLEIQVNTSLEYYYELRKDDEIKDKKDYKSQTTYTTTFIYIYDPDAYIPDKHTFSVHCPNCGAPLKNINNRICQYCNSKVNDINLRSWYIIDYKENY